MDRLGKKSTVASMREEFSSAETVIVVHNNGLTVGEMTRLRQQMRALGASFRVAKNTLAILATEGTQYEPIKGMFFGPTGVAFSEDPVAAAKGIANFAKDNPKLVIVGGAIGAEVLDVDKVNQLSKLPSLDELRAKILAMLNTPATRIAGVVQAPAGQIARVIKAHAEQA